LVNLVHAAIEQDALDTDTTAVVKEVNENPQTLLLRVGIDPSSPTMDRGVRSSRRRCIQRTLFADRGKGLKQFRMTSLI